MAGTSFDFAVGVESKFLLARKDFQLVDCRRPLHVAGDKERPVPALLRSRPSLAVEVVFPEPWRPTIMTLSGRRRLSASRLRRGVAPVRRG